MYEEEGSKVVGMVNKSQINDLWNRTFYNYIVYQLHVLSQFAQCYRFLKAQYQKRFHLEIVVNKS